MRIAWFGNRSDAVPANFPGVEAAAERAHVQETVPEQRA
jgi:hypothetical protein